MFLGFISIGIADVCFVRPYKMAVFGEYYAELRHVAKERGIPGSAQLNDRYLFEKAEEPLLEKAYRDVLGRIKEPVPVPELQGIRGFFSRWFGVVLSNSAAETAYEKACAEQAKLRKWAEILEGKAYPERLFPISFRERTETLETIRYARNYSVLSLLLLFFTCSFMGWLWEVSLHLITSGTFVNRGVSPRSVAAHLRDGKRAHTDRAQTPQEPPGIGISFCHCSLRRSGICDLLVSGAGKRRKMVGLYRIFSQP